MWVALINTQSAGKSPKVTVAPLWKLEPVKEAVVAPAVGPELGVTEYRLGGAVNIAATLLVPSIVTTHVPIPEHPAPFHPANAELLAVAVRVTTVP
jgi:hypothetical protein